MCAQSRVPNAGIHTQAHIRTLMHACTFANKSACHSHSSTHTHIHTHTGPGAWAGRRTPTKSRRRRCSSATHCQRLTSMTLSAGDRDRERQGMQMSRAQTQAHKHTQAQVQDRKRGERRGEEGRGERRGPADLPWLGLVRQPRQQQQDDSRKTRAVSLSAHKRAKSGAREKRERGTNAGTVACNARQRRWNERRGAPK